MKPFQKKKAIGHITVFPQEKSLPIYKQCSVLELLLENKIPMDYSCAGMGTCGTCRVEVLDCPSAYPEKSDLEIEMAKEIGYGPQERQSCQMPALDGLKIEILNLQQRMKRKKN